MIEKDEVPVADAAQEQWNKYLNAYFVWAEEWERNLLKTREFATAWQAEHDVPYPVYRLTMLLRPRNGAPLGKRRELRSGL